MRESEQLMRTVLEQDWNYEQPEGEFSGGEYVNNSRVDDCIRVKHRLENLLANSPSCFDESQLRSLASLPDQAPLSEAQYWGPSDSALRAFDCFDITYSPVTVDFSAIRNIAQEILRKRCVP